MLYNSTGLVGVWGREKDRREGESNDWGKGHLPGEVDLQIGLQ